MEVLDGRALDLDLLDLLDLDLVHGLDGRALDRVSSALDLLLGLAPHPVLAVSKL